MPSHYYNRTGSTMRSRRSRVTARSRRNNVNRTRRSRTATMVNRNTNRNRRSLLSRGSMGRAFRSRSNRSRNSVLRRANAIRNRGRGVNMMNVNRNNAGNGQQINRHNQLVNSFDDVRMVKGPTGNTYRKVSGNNRR